MTFFWKLYPGAVKAVFRRVSALSEFLFPVYPPNRNKKK